jgi:hypothetical protein
MIGLHPSGYVQEGNRTFRYVILVASHAGRGPLRRTSLCRSGTATDVLTLRYRFVVWARVLRGAA